LHLFYIKGNLLNNPSTRLILTYRTNSTNCSRFSVNPYLARIRE